MVVLLTFLRANWRPLAIGLALVLAISGVVYSSRLYAHRKLRLETQTTVVHRAAAVAADTRAQRAADSAFFFRQGQRYELSRQLATPPHAKPAILLPPIATLPHGQ